MLCNLGVYNDKEKFIKVMASITYTEVSELNCYHPLHISAQQGKVYDIIF